MTKKNICKWLILYPLCSFFILTSPIHACMPSCVRGIDSYQNDYAISVSTFPRYSLLFFFFTVLALSPFLHLISAFFMIHFIFQCNVTIISISAPSGFSKVCIPLHQTVAMSKYEKSY